MNGEILTVLCFWASLRTPSGSACFFAQFVSLTAKLANASPSTNPFSANCCNANEQLFCRATLELIIFSSFTSPGNFKSNRACSAALASVPPSKGLQTPDEGYRHRH